MRFCSEYTGIINSCGLFSDAERESIRKEIADDVMPLLNIEKPKVMVYGIYNSGKSTLVNAIFRKQVAEVANRPMTWKTAEYDAGKYIVVDSPGINAPQEHEEVADSYIRKCHVILFVISSKGVFEDKVNYNKMLDLINMNLPFIIVLNDRGVPDDEKDKHNQELNGIKQKILENLKRVSGINNIESRYDVIVLNAQRAWNGIEKNKQTLVDASRLSDLTNRIDQLLESNEYLKIYLAPLSALERSINGAEKILMSRSVSKDLAGRREILQQKIDQFKNSFDGRIRSSVESRFDEIYQGFLGNTNMNISRVYDEICRDTEETYARMTAPIADYISRSFGDLGLTVDNAGHVKIASTQDSQKPSIWQDTSEPEDIPYKPDVNIAADISAASISAAATAGAAAGAALGSVVPVVGTALGGAIGGVLAGGTELFRQIFQSRASREKQEYERRLREVEAHNAREARRVEAEDRRRQDARMAATNQVNEIIRQLRASYSEAIEKNFSTVIQMIDNQAAKISRISQKTAETIAKFGQLKEKINDTRRRISYDA